MATFVWDGQIVTTGVSTILAAHKMSFFGTAFDSGIIVNDWQDKTFHENDSKVSQNELHNCKYIGPNTINIDGGGDVALNGTNLVEADCTLDLEFGHGSAVAITNCIFWIYGSSESSDPTDVAVQACEQGDTAWTACGGAGTDLTLGDSGSSTEHHWFLGISISPTSIGEKDTEFTMKCSLTYQ